MKKMTKFWNAVKIPLLAILCSLVVGGVIIAVTGSNPLRLTTHCCRAGGLAPKSSYASYKSMLTDFMSYVNYFTPMIFAALAVAVALRARTVQYRCLRTDAGSRVHRKYHCGLQQFKRCTGKAAGSDHRSDRRRTGGWTDRLLKYRFNINEVVSSIMLNYTFQYVISFFINTFSWIRSPDSQRRSPQLPD